MEKKGMGRGRQVMEVEGRDGKGRGKKMEKGDGKKTNKGRKGRGGEGK